MFISGICIISYGSLVVVPNEASFYSHSIGMIK